MVRKSNLCIVAQTATSLTIAPALVATLQRFIFTKTMVLKDKSGVRFVTLNSTLTKIDSQKPLPFVALTAPEHLVLCQDLVQVKMSFSHSNLPAIPKLPVDTILQNHRVTYNRNDYEFVWYYKTFPSIQIPGGMHVCNC